MLGSIKIQSVQECPMDTKFGKNPWSNALVGSKVVWISWGQSEVILLWIALWPPTTTDESVMHCCWSLAMLISGETTPGTRKQPCNFFFFFFDPLFQRYNGGSSGILPQTEWGCINYLKPGIRILAQCMITPLVIHVVIYGTIMAAVGFHYRLIEQVLIVHKIRNQASACHTVWSLY